MKILQKVLGVLLLCLTL